GQELRLLGTGFGQVAIDGGEDFPRLLGDALAGILMRDDAGEINGVAVDDDLAHPRADLLAFNVHEISLPRRRDGCDLELVILSRFWPADQRMRQEGLMQCSRRSSSLLDWIDARRWHAPPSIRLGLPGSGTAR